MPKPKFKPGTRVSFRYYPNRDEETGVGVITGPPIQYSCTGKVEMEDYLVLIEKTFDEGDPGGYFKERIGCKLILGANKLTEIVAESSEDS